MCSLHIILFWTTLTNFIARSTQVLSDSEVDEVVLVTDIANRTAKLPCDWKTVLANDAVTMVFWYKLYMNPNKSTIYTMDARNKSLAEASFYSLNKDPKLQFFPYSNPPTLHIKSLNKEDAGTYMCRVDFKSSPTRNIKVILEVIVLPETPVIYVQGSHVTDHTRPFLEGDSVTFSCEVNGGEPEPHVYWQTSRMEVTSYDPLRAHRRLVPDLRLPSLSRADFRAVISCLASNNNMSRPLSSSVTLEMYLKPVAAQIGGRGSTTLYVGRTTTVNCTARGSWPPANISWWLGDKPLKSFGILEAPDGQSSESYVTFTPSPEDHLKKLICRAENSHVTNSAVEDSFRLNVLFPPQVSIVLGKPLIPDNIKEGDDVYFDCFISANPPVEKVVWVHNKVEIEPYRHDGIIVSNQSLVLQKITRDRKGNYTCRAANREGEGVSNIMKLYIKYAPRCREDQKFVYGASLKESIQLTCHVDSNPAPDHYDWMFNNPAETQDIQAHGRSLVFTPEREVHFGSLLCFATNPLGKQRDPCVYQILEAGPPQPVENCTVMNHTTVSLSVSCTALGETGLPQTYVLEVFDSESQALFLNVTSALPMFHIESTEIDSDVILAIYAVNEKGVSPKVRFQPTNMKLAEKRSGQVNSYGISPILGILVGVLLVLLLAILAIFIVMRCRPMANKKPPTVLPGEKLKLDDKDTSCPHVQGDDTNPDIIAQAYGPSVEQTHTNQAHGHTYRDTEIKLQDNQGLCYVTTSNQIVSSPASPPSYPSGSRAKQLITKVTRQSPQLYTQESQV